MAGFAKVDSIQTLKELRASLCKFADTARSAVGGADSEIRRTAAWLQQDRGPYWKNEIRNRTELVARAKSALNHKKLYKSPTGRRQSCIEEEKALLLAKRRLEEAEAKCENVRRWIQKLEQEMFLYRGQVQGAGRMVDTDIPNAVAMLDRALDSLDAYAIATSSGGGGAKREAAQSMSRSSPESPEEAYAVYRNRTPSAKQLASAVAMEESLEWASDVRIASTQRRALIELSIERSPVSKEASIIVARGVWREPSFYLERVELGGVEAFGPDVWYIGSIETRDEEEASARVDLAAVSAETLLASRSDLAELLAMPTGVIAVVRGQTVEAVLNKDDKPLWLGGRPV